MPKGLPNSRNAYIEACNKPSPKAEQLWSHAAVYLAGRDSGWHMLANEIERKAYPIFNETYRKYCDRVLAGEKLEIAKSDPDVWIKASQKADGFKYYEMILCYVDDVISIGESPMKAIEGIKTPACFHTKRLGSTAAPNNPAPKVAIAVFGSQS